MNDQPRYTTWKVMCDEWRVIDPEGHQVHLGPFSEAVAMDVAAVLNSVRYPQQPNKLNAADEPGDL